jgi:hypothetical protein
MIVATQQIPVPPMPPGGHMSVSGGLSDVAAVIMVFAILGTALLIAWPLVRALARRLEGGATKELLLELDGLRGRVQQLEEGQARLGELEERLDFAERMLAQSRETDRLPR